MNFFGAKALAEEAIITSEETVIFAAVSLLLLLSFSAEDLSTCTLRPRPIGANADRLPRHYHRPESS